MRFELWQKADGSYEVRPAVAMQTLRQLRDMPQVTAAAPPASMEMEVPGCTAANTSCEWKDFYRIADTALDKNHVFPMQH